MGRNKNYLNKKKKMSNSDWVQKMVHLDLMIRDQHFDRAINYFHEDFVNYGFIEAHNIKGKEGLKILGKKTPKFKKRYSGKSLIWKVTYLLDVDCSRSTNLKLEFISKTTNFMPAIIKFLKQQDFDRAINYFHEDYTNHAFLEEHNIKG